MTLTWSYRILKRGDGTYALHEVYFDGHGNVDGWTEEPITFEVDPNEGKAGILQELAHALGDALRHDVIDVSKLENHA